MSTMARMGGGLRAALALGPGRGNLLRIAVPILLAGPMAWGPAAAEPVSLGGHGPPLVLVAGRARATRSRDTLAVVVVVGGRYAGDPEARLHVGIPPGLTLLSGDTVRAGRMSAIIGNYALRLAPRDTGSFVLRGRLIVQAGDRRDEAAMEMPVTVDSDTVVADDSRYTCLELTRSGRRYRYAGWWLVPLDGDEPAVIERDIEAHGQRARATVAPAAVCPRCSAASIGDSVRFVVVVGPDGLARDRKALGFSRRPGRRLDQRAASAAQGALKRWSFEPARLNGQPVSDWLYVSVPIQRGP